MSTTIVTAENAKEFLDNLINTYPVMRLAENEKVDEFARIPTGKYNVSGYDMAQDGQEASLFLTAVEDDFPVSFPVAGVWSFNDKLIKARTKTGTFHFIGNPLW